jgi:hypothetical protein
MSYKICRISPEVNLEGCFLDFGRVLAMLSGVLSAPMMLKWHIFKEKTPDWPESGVSTVTGDCLLLFNLFL